MQRAFQLAPGPMYRKAPPVKDAGYLRYVRNLFCLVCGASYAIESAHTGGRGLGQRSSDRNAIPLCRRHHRTADDSLHTLGPVQFANPYQPSALPVELLDALPSAQVVDSQSQRIAARPWRVSNLWPHGLPPGGSPSTPP